MSESVTVPLVAAVVAGVVTVIGALVTGIVTIISAYKIAKIEAHVNSEKTAAEGRQIALTNENILLKKQMERDERTAQLLAQAAATMAAITQRPNRASDFPQPVPVEEPVQVEVVNQPLLTTPAPKGKG